MPKNTACKVVMSFRSLDVYQSEEDKPSHPSVAARISAAQTAQLHLHIASQQICSPIIATAKRARQPSRPGRLQRLLRL